MNGVVQKYFDFSNVALGIGAFTLFTVFLAAKYGLDTWNTYRDSDEFTDTQILIYSVVIALLAVVIIMAGYKQIMIYRGRKSLLNEGFYDP